MAEKVTVLRAAASIDGYGDPVTDWTTPTRTDVYARGVEPRPSGEPVQDARNAVTSGFTVYLPLGTDLTPADRLEVRGKAYDVLGEPAEWRNPWGGGFGGLVVQTERTEG
jgi:head-tail adaptor